MKVLIDNGHGCDTPGKRSPDGRLREYAYTREIAARLADTLRLAGIETECIVPEEYDVPLDERARRANRIYDECNRDAILVSIHCNAAGDGSRWMSARGWSVYVDNYASFNSCNLASTMSKEPTRKELRSAPHRGICLTGRTVYISATTPTAPQCLWRTSFRTTWMMWTISSRKMASKRSRILWQEVLSATLKKWHSNDKESADILR